MIEGIIMQKIFYPAFTEADEKMRAKTPRRNWEIIAEFIMQFKKKEIGKGFALILKYNVNS